MKNEEPETREIQTRALRSSGWGLLRTSAGLPLTVLATVVLARKLDADGFGEYALYGFVVPTLIALSDLGLTNGFAQRGATAFGTGDRSTLERLSGQTLTWALLRWPFLYVGVAVVLADLIAALLFAVVAVTSAGSAGVGLALNATVRGAELSRLTFLASTAAALATISTALLDAPPSRIFAAGLAAQYAVLAAQVLFLRGDPSLRRACLRPRSLAGTRPDFAFGLSFYASGQLAQLTLSRSELLFFGPAQGFARGVYAAAFTVGSRLTLPIDALYGALGASLSAVGERGDAGHRAALRTFRMSGSLFSLLCGPGVIAGLIAADVMFPASFVGVTLAAVALTGSSFLVSAAYPASALYYAERRVRPLFVAGLVAFATNVTLSFLLIRAYGVSGAVVANAGSAIVYCGTLIAPIARHGPLREAVRTYVRVIVFSLVAAIAVGAALTSVDDRLLRWGLGGLLAVCQPLLVLRLLPSADRGDFRVVRDHLPGPARKVVVAAERRLARER